jgi:hypothetical protein
MPPRTLGLRIHARRVDPGHVESVLDLQLELWKRIAIANRRLIVGGQPELQAAFSDFDRSFPERFHVVEEKQILRAACLAPYVLVGDYHPLPAAQLQAARWVRQLRPRVLGLEIFGSHVQQQLDQWSASSHDAAWLLRELEFEKHWPLVPIRGFSELLETARENSTRLVGCEDPRKFEGEELSLEQRDEHMAAVLQEHAQKRAMLLVGDVHLRPGSLPARLPQALVLHQNQARYYFAMGQAGRDTPEYIQLGKGRYSWQGVHPLLVEESCLRSMTREEDAFLPQPADWFVELAERIAGILEIELPPIPTLLTTHDPVQRSLLASLASKPAAARYAVNSLRIRGSHRFSEETIVLHETGTNHVSEALGRWLHESRIPKLPSSASPLVQLVADTRLEAAGFLSSILVNPLRRPKPMLFYRNVLGIPAKYRGLSELGRRLEQAISLGAAIGNEPWPKASSAEGLLLTRCVGQSLGAQLRSVWLQSQEMRSEVLDLLACDLQDEKDITQLTQRVQTLL